MRKLRLEFQYTQEEYVKAERKFLLASGVITIPKIVIAIAYCAYAVWYFLSTKGSAMSYLFLGVALFAILAGGALYFIAPVRHFKEAAKLQGRYSLVFAELGITLITPTLQSELKWDSFIELWESGADYYLIQRGRRYTLIPKRAFQDGEARADFEALTLGKTGKPKRTI